MIDFVWFELSPYAFAIVLGAACALVLGAAYARQVQLSPNWFWTAAVIVVLAGLVGARLAFVIQHPAYFADNPDLVLDFQAGGLAWHGALAGGGLALILVSMTGRLVQRGRSLLGSLADAAAVGLPVALALGWVGAHAVNAYYGAFSDSPLAQELPDTYGIYDLRYPVQLFAAGWYFLTAVLVLRLAWPPARPRFACVRPAGLVAGAFLSLFAAGDFGLTFLRGDEIVRWNGLAAGQWLDLVVACFGLVLLAASWHSYARLAVRRVLAVEWDKLFGQEMNG